MHLEASRTFKKLYKKLPEDVQQQTKKALRLLAENQSHPSLGHKKMAGQKDIFELRASQNYRITYQKINDIAYLRKVGTHTILNHP